MQPRSLPVRAGTPQRGTRPPRTTGYTLIELMVVVGIAALLIAAVTVILLNSQAAFSTGVTIETVQATTTRLVNQVAGELKDASIASLGSPYNSNSISFRKNLGQSGGVVTLSSVITYAYQTNSDTKLGDGKLVRTQDSASTTIGTYVKSTNPDTSLPGFCVTKNGSQITISVTAQQTDTQGRVVRYTAATSVCPMTQ